MIIGDIPHISDVAICDIPTELPEMLTLHLKRYLTATTSCPVAVDENLEWCNVSS